MAKKATKKGEVEEEVLPSDAVVSDFKASDPQWAFLESKATVRGYGGAMGGGKSRTMCEAILDYCLDYPGIQILVVRQRHTTITETTRKTMVEKVLPPLFEVGAVVGKKQSQGEDWIEIRAAGRMVRPNGEEVVFAEERPSRINFIGLDDPVKWYSSEIGCLVFDEAHEIAEQDVVELMTRLRQTYVCPVCKDRAVKGCGECEDGMAPYPHKTLIGFNPANPGHWLERWFVYGAAQTEFGFYKPELFFKDAAKPVGDCEFVFANAYANRHLPKGYIERTLESLPSKLRDRLLLGQWVLTDGSTFFDADALTAYLEELPEMPWRQGETAGDVSGANREDPVRVRVHPAGPLSVWKPPVRERDGKPAHRYVAAVDVSSGGAADFSAIQVLDFEGFEQVAELQVKLDPDLVAVEAYRLAAIYNGALIAPEVTGGYGSTVVRVVETLNARWKGPRSSMPRLYTRRVEDRIAKRYTDRLGFDTNVHTRVMMLDLLEQSIRERSLRLNGRRTHSELAAFAYAKSKRDDKPGRAQAVAGTNDDLVMALAIGVYVILQQPQQIKRQIVREEPVLVSATGY